MLAILLACKSHKEINDGMIVSEKKIKYLSKSWESEIYTTYEANNLQKEKNTITFNNDTIFVENSDYEYFYEVYDNRFLLISFKEKSDWSWSGADTVLKDSLYIIDLHLKEKRFCSLIKTMFARQKSDLKKLYNYSENMIISNDYAYHYAIDSIDFKNNKLFLTKPNFSTKVCELEFR